MSIVTYIPQRLTINSMPLNTEFIKKKVCAYARVSTDTEEQQNSYEAQVDHYTRHIQANDKWEFVGVYADKDRSGTSTKKRENFKRMISDAMAGKIDLILTKSVSRFARNTVDTLTIVRDLKDVGVEIYFEKENIYTLDSKGELLITIMGSLAQEESRSISENVTWGARKRMESGKVTLPYKRFLGYEKGEDGKPKIVEEEAVTVRLIYKLYLQGKTQNVIAKYLTEQGIPSPSGKPKWYVATVQSILKNEKYKGDALLQKKFTPDFLTKKIKVNNGEVPQYYVKDSHPAIIEPETFDLVQAEIIHRRTRGYKQNGTGFFGSRIVCGECGSFYGPKVWHSNSKYRRTVWQCNRKFESKTYCKTKHLYEAEIQEAFIEAFNQLYRDKERLMEEYTEIIEKLTDTDQLDKKEKALQEKCETLSNLVQKAVEENARSEQNQDAYHEKYDALLKKYDAVRNKFSKISEERQLRMAKSKILSHFIEKINRSEGLLEAFDEDLWFGIMETITMHSDGTATFTFKGGREVKMDMRKK